MMGKTIKVSDETYVKLETMRLSILREKTRKRQTKSPERVNMTFNDAILQREKDIERLDEEVNGLTRQLWEFGVRPYWTKHEWVKGCICGAYSIDGKPAVHAKICPLSEMKT